MATYYWVGSTGTWDVSTTTHWSASSGGAGGAGVPTTGDTVYIDANSGTGTITLSTNPSLAYLNMTGYAGTFTHTAGYTITITGTLFYLSSAMTYTVSNNFTSKILFSGGTTNFNPAGRNVGTVTIGNSASATATSVTLINDLTCNGNLVIADNASYTTTFNANGKNVTAISYSVNNLNTGTCNVTLTNLTITGDNTSTGITNSRVYDVYTTSGTLNQTISTLLKFTAATVNALSAKHVQSTGTSTYYNVEFAGGGTAQVINYDIEQTVNQLMVDGNGVARSIKFVHGVTYTSTVGFNLQGTSGFPLTITSDDGANAFTLSTAVTYNIFNYCTISYCTTAGGAIWVAKNSTNVTGNGTFTWALNKNAIASGNASTAAIWEGGVAPLPYDSLFANGKTVTIDNSYAGTGFTVADLNTGVGTSINSSNGFVDHYLTNSAVPYMTSNTVPAGYTITDSASSANAYKAFERRQSSYTGGSAGWMKVQLGVAATYKSFLLQQSGTVNWATITVAGSNDDITYTTLYSAGEGSYANILRNFTVTGSYTYYKISWSGAVTPAITNIELGTQTAAYVGNIATDIVSSGGFNTPAGTTPLTINASIYQFTPGQNGLLSGANNNTIVTVYGTVYGAIGNVASGYTTTGGVNNCTVYGTVYGGQSGGGGTSDCKGAYNCIIYGDVYGGIAAGNNTYGAANCIIYGNVYSLISTTYGAYNCQIIGQVKGTNGGSYGAYYDSLYSLSSTVITGDQTSQGTGTGALIYFATGIVGSYTINGNIYGSTTASAISVVQNASATKIYINGGVGVAAYGVAVSATQGIVDNISIGEIHVTNNISGGYNPNTIAVSLRTAAGKLYCSGTMTGGTNATNSPAVLVSIAGTTVDCVNITTGLVGVSNGYPAIVATALFNCYIRGNQTYVNGIDPAFGLVNQVWNVDPSASMIITMQDTSNANRAFSSGAIAANYPATNVVLAGVTYGVGSIYTGTLVSLNAGDVWNYLLANATVANSFGVYLKNAATVASTGAQIAAAIH